MVRRICTLMIILTMPTLLLFACSSTASSNIAKGKVPDQLATIEAQAEDIIDITPGGNWKTINRDIVSISDAWKTYQSQAIGDGATQSMLDTFDAALNNLQTAASAQDKMVTMQASNDISAVVVDLFDLYHPAIPADVGWLDVLERQVVLDAAAGNFTSISADLKKINDVWGTLRPSVLAHDGQEIASQFEASLTIQTKALDAKNPEGLTQEAANALEIVDEMERLY